MPKKIGGNVYWIENGQQTIKVVDAEAAFSNPDQARSQIQFAEASGDKKQIRLVRLAYRQFQGMRYRGESKSTAGKAAKVDHRPRTRKPLKAKPSKKPVGRKVARKAPKVAPKP